MIKNEKPLDLDAEYEEEPVTFGGALVLFTRSFWM